MLHSANRFVVGSVWGAAMAACALVLTPTFRAAADEQQQPSFRSAVDLIAVDVQVVDKTGTPIGPLDPSSFQVTISGKPRRVVSADFIRSTNVDGTPFVRTNNAGPVATNIWPELEDPRAGRIYILAFDVGSLTLTDSRAMVASALTFIDRLLPTDQVGLYTFPIGARIEPTTDHALVRQKVTYVTGTPQGFTSRYNLSPAEVVDINAEAARMHSSNVGRGGPANVALFGDESETIRAVQIRECGTTDLRCVDEIIAEAQSLAFYLEGRATEGINGIRSLINVLADVPGRKTLVMFSAGITASDRPGGRPDLGDLPKTLGQDAAATNTTIYTIHVDTGRMRAMSPETRRPTAASYSLSRDHEVGGRVLDEFSGASGGALMRIITGSGEYALDRVLRETSSHYLLGVVPDDSDRDGKLRQLRVKVNESGATVRSRSWVVIPKQPGA